MPGLYPFTLIAAKARQLFKVLICQFLQNADQIVNYAIVEEVAMFALFLKVKEEAGEKLSDQLKSQSQKRKKVKQRKRKEGRKAENENS